MTEAADAAGALARLDEVTRRLRRECPWDREQDERSIVPHTVEEAYELADAARSGDDARMHDELGDVLFQVYFLALLLEERGSGSLSSVADGLTEKLVRRHPHVFGADADAEAASAVEGRSAETAADVLGNWDQIKREVEGRGAEDPFADVPENLPGLLYARKLLRRAYSADDGSAGEADQAGAGPSPDHEVALERAGRALARLGDVAPAGASAGPAAEARQRDLIEECIGDALLALVDVARTLKADPELAVRASADGLRTRGA
ncbi:MAG: MazG nucleotide pyrophosphohydrolase domain-containing protein [Solirubrobacterales bacterium]